MAWSTNQLADLAGVTLRSIRHWHDVGLLPEPGRLSNGYKQYTARHLVLALRIARLTSLGFSLEHVDAMLESEEQGQKSLHGLRSELDERIAELTRIRADIDALIARGSRPISRQKRSSRWKHSELIRDPATSRYCWRDCSQRKTCLPSPTP